ncbi:hypothetical protein [Legionella birminghamensis]|uniref:Uncharacterized protein n=1 Tax=Legionella birminghamensis TaxID=28083 RepID=A0A378IA76_9GAMM|nr:hypothetical protein [Legionella birminghamensis]STX32138.1 Uncharacterised protein [Legionella birminghamensis]
MKEFLEVLEGQLEHPSVLFETITLDGKEVSLKSEIGDEIYLL